MRIESLYLRDIGPFDEVKIDFPEGKDPNLADVYLLTGPNGCGKSTVLYAIAALIAAGEGYLGEDNLWPRSKSRGAFASLKGLGADRVAAWLSADGSASPIYPSLDGAVQEQPLSPVNLSTSTLSYFEGTPGFPYQAKGHSYSSPFPAEFEWAAFAYSGKRSIEDVHVTEIREPRKNPLESSLDFNHSTNSGELIQWIANQQFRKLKAKDTGNLKRAAQIEQSVIDIENIISEICEDSISFVMNADDNDIRVRRNGELLNINVLAAGLQSIMSWLANLLMRLERLHWVNDLPVNQRPFLLLLDEVDIYLHPAWQRKVIPAVQRLFPNAQIIASTHSPFVVSSAEDAHVIAFAVENGKSRLVDVLDSQKGTSYSAVLREIFGIESEFDVLTEEMFATFREAKARLLRGETADRAEVDQLARQLAERSQEVSQIIGLELRQLDRQLAQRATGG